MAESWVISKTTQALWNNFSVKTTSSLSAKKILVVGVVDILRHKKILKGRETNTDKKLDFLRHHFVV